MLTIGKGKKLMGKKTHFMQPDCFMTESYYFMFSFVFGLYYNAFKKEAKQGKTLKQFLIIITLLS